MAEGCAFQEAWDDSLVRDRPSQARSQDAGWLDPPPVLDLSGGPFVPEAPEDLRPGIRPGTATGTRWTEGEPAEPPDWTPGAVALTDTPDGLLVSVIFGGQARPLALLPGCSAAEFEEAELLDR